MNNRIKVDSLTHNYDTRCALDNINFTVSTGEILCFLGPNGSGKTTLFKILSTLMSPTSGSVDILGFDLRTEKAAIRKLMGVVFQNPGLDIKLTVRENLLHQGSLYGLSGRSLNIRIAELLERFHITDRANEFVEKLSGGIQRRVDIVKALLHKPKVLLLDEPSSGLDVSVRSQLSQYLSELKKNDNILVMLTTHLLDEADRCTLVGILDKGRLVTFGTPDELKSEIGGDVVIIECEDCKTLCQAIENRYGINPVLTDDCLHIECNNTYAFVRDVVGEFHKQIKTVRFGKPTLADVFIRKTGNPFTEG